MCKGTAGGACPKHVHRSEGHPRGSRLASCTCAAAEAWAGCWWGCWAPVGQWEVKSREGPRWLVSAKVSVCGAKTSDICRGSVAAVLAISYFGGKRCWGLRSTSQGTTVISATGLMLGALALSPCFSPSLFISAFPVSGWVLCSVPQKAGEAGGAPHCPFLGEGNSF